MEATMPIGLEARSKLSDRLDTVESCPFKTPTEIRKLAHREYPHWHRLLNGRHIGVHRQDDRICNWVARTLRSNGNYRQKCLGAALPLSKPAITYEEAIKRAFEWFETSTVQALSVPPECLGRVSKLSICPIGDVYTVGHAMTDYLEWSKLARSEGGHYNNLTLMNHHLVSEFSSIPIEEFRGQDLQKLAVNTLEQPPKRGFETLPEKVQISELTTDEIRRRKRTFNSLVTILRMVFRYAWENGHLKSERSWKRLNRVSVNHRPRSVFLSRPECQRLLTSCAPSLRKLVMAALYTGCRVGELGALRVEDVGSGGFGIHIKPFKRSPARIVFLPEEGMAFFLQMCVGKQGADFVFLSKKGMPWRRQHTLQFRTAVAKAGLPKEFVFHGLRHTYASDLIQGGANLDTVAKQLGHASTLTVMNTYGHLAAGVREAQVHRHFSALSEDNEKLAMKHQSLLSELRKTELPDGWDREGNSEPQSTLPRSPLARPSKAVLEVFTNLPGKH